MKKSHPTFDRPGDSSLSPVDCRAWSSPCSVSSSCRSWGPCVMDRHGLLTGSEWPDTTFGLALRSGVLAPDEDSTGVTPSCENQLLQRRRRRKITALACFRVRGRRFMAEQAPRRRSATPERAPPPILRIGGGGTWSRSGSNRQPPRCDRGALPIELRPQAMGLDWFPPTTAGPRIVPTSRAVGQSRSRGLEADFAVRPQAQVEQRPESVNSWCSSLKPSGRSFLRPPAQPATS